VEFAFSSRYGSLDSTVLESVGASVLSGVGNLLEAGGRIVVLFAGTAVSSASTSDEEQQPKKARNFDGLFFCWGFAGLSSAIVAASLLSSTFTPF
jgi:hypothetical protein